MERRMPALQAAFRKGQRTRDITVDTYWMSEKAKEYQEEVNMCFIHNRREFNYVSHVNLWNLLTKAEIPEFVLFLMWNLYIDQKAAVNMQHNETNKLQLGRANSIVSMIIVNEFIFL